MKTMHLSIAGLFAAASFAIVEGKGVPELGENASRPQLFSSSAVDTVPAKGTYRDLITGESIGIWYDVVGKRTLNKKTGAPVYFYINTATNDTVLGRGRFVVNNYLIKGGDGKWKLNEERVRFDGDELKVKVGDEKLKIDGEEVKSKSNGVDQKNGN